MQGGKSESTLRIQARSGIIRNALAALMACLAVVGTDLEAAKADDAPAIAPMSPFDQIAQFKRGSEAYGRGDYAEAIRLWKPMADTGHNIFAEYYLALLYADGKGTPRDMNKARAYMEVAANSGSAGARHWLEVNGFRAPPTYSVAECAQAIESKGRDQTERMMKSCPGLKAGSAEFHVKLADLLLNEYGDVRVAIVNYKAAAEMGSAVARARLAKLTPPARTANAGDRGWPPVCQRAVRDNLRVPGAH